MGEIDFLCFVTNQTIWSFKELVGQIFLGSRCRMAGTKKWYQYLYFCVSCTALLSTNLVDFVDDLIKTSHRYWLERSWFDTITNRPTLTSWIKPWWNSFDSFSKRFKSGFWLIIDRRQHGRGEGFLRYLRWLNHILIPKMLWLIVNKHITVLFNTNLWMK